MPAHFPVLQRLLPSLHVRPASPLHVSPILCAVHLRETPCARSALRHAVPGVHAFRPEDSYALPRPRTSTVLVLTHVVPGVHASRPDAPYVTPRPRASTVLVLRHVVLGVHASRLEESCAPPRLRASTALVPSRASLAMTVYRLHADSAVGSAPPRVRRHLLPFPPVSPPSLP